MNLKTKKFLIAFFTFIGGLYFFLEFILPEKIYGFSFGKYNDQITEGVQVISLMAIGLGLINILTVHAPRVLRLRSGSINSLALIFGLISVIFVQGFDLRISEKSSAERTSIEQLSLFATKLLETFQSNKQAPVSQIQNLSDELDQITSDTKSRDSLFNVEFESPIEQSVAQSFQENLTLAQSKILIVKNLYLEASNLKTAYNDQLKLNSQLEIENSALIQALKNLSTSTHALVQLNYERSWPKKADHFIFESFFTPLGSSIFALLAFYIATAAYRAMRIRNLEALVLMIPALLVMLGQIPHGPLYISTHLPSIRSWLLINLNTPAFRAIYFGSTVAALAMAVRMWLSLEKSPLSSDDQTQQKRN